MKNDSHLSSMNYTLRPATDADYDFLYKLHAVTIRPSVEATWGWDEAVQQTLFRERWNAVKTQVVVFESTEVGTVRLDENQDEVFLALIEIHPDFQNRGLGTAILQDVLADASRKRFSVGLQVLKANESAKRLYERLGFCVIEEQAERFVMRWLST